MSPEIKYLYNRVDWAPGAYSIMCNGCDLFKRGNAKYSLYCKDCASNLVIENLLSETKQLKAEVKQLRDAKSKRFDRAVVAIREFK